MTQRSLLVDKLREVDEELESLGNQSDNWVTSLETWTDSTASSYSGPAPIVNEDMNASPLLQHVPGFG
jgi:hypothetical protein